MEQPFINQEGQNNFAVQGNIYGTDNQNPNQAQIPSNPEYMMPPNMNPPQAQQPPEQPYDQPQTQNITYDKPLNAQNNQIPPPSQPYPQNAIPTQPQPVYPPPQAQGMPVPAPQISPQPVYPPQGVPQTNYPPQYPPQVGGVPVQVQPVQPVYNAQYQNYNNISQIRHKGVFQPDENTFYIETGCVSKSMPYILTIFGIFLLVIPFFNMSSNLMFAFFIGAIFLFSGLISCCKLYNKIYFIMGPNTLTVMKKANCGKQTKIYNPGELMRVEFNYNYAYSSSMHGGGYTHNYTLIAFPTNGPADQIFSYGSSNPIFTVEEMEYFLYYINTHILTKMKV